MKKPNRTKWKIQGPSVNGWAELLINTENTNTKNMKTIEIRVPHTASPEVYFHESKSEMRKSLMEELDSKGREYPRNASLKKLMGLVDDFHLFYLMSLKEAKKHSENGTLPSYQTHKKFETLKKLNGLIDSM